MLNCATLTSTKKPLLPSPWHSTRVDWLEWWKGTDQTDKQTNRKTQPKNIRLTRESPPHPHSQLRVLRTPPLLSFEAECPRFAPFHSMLRVSAERGKQRKPRTTALIEHIATESQFQTAPTLSLECIATESQFQTVATLS